MNADTLTDAFKFLDRLRDGGSVNMWGATPYVKSALDLSEEDARSAHSKWMDTFDGRSVKDRVAAALA